jgi:aryl-alcohol dehydrogenase-like predicted oxidoreductase
MATLGLGTVQFGLNYGISNQIGKPSTQEIESILRHFCNKNSSAIIDTARNYGDSEIVLGNFSNLSANARMITKIPPLRKDCSNLTVKNFYEKALNESLQKLKLQSVDTLLTHHALDFQTPSGGQISEFLKASKEQKKCNRIGVSAYSEQEVQYVIDHFFLPDVVQLPMNIFDQKLLLSGFLGRLKKMGVEIHIRSAYLQGLLFLNPIELPSYFWPIKDVLKELHQFLSSQNISPAHYALQFLNKIPEVDFIILGINQLKELIEAEDFIKNPLPEILNGPHFEKWNIDDVRFTNPSLWKISL